MKIIKKVLAYKFIRYSIWWWLAAIFDIALLRVFTDIFHIYYLYSAILSFIFAFSFWYVFQKYITFKDYSNKHILQWGLFLLFQLIGQGIYILLLWIGVQHMWIYYMYVAIAAKWIAFIRNYISNYLFNFKK
ncbi:MAG: hypothetical protein ACD_80C00152G0002 [uncultured bacterium (gcode 4)]|uniref:GtrA/DPMS transmembrane domain-containing protein n=1 Tax=uncultured bacterium (gcode 4) TaxID=1234023 RepID=K1XWJ1_9BACT|nr:MAG: hypothetical protein ACD_80C00152G0002 [uncultured bacterium (gcode 4)]